MYLLAKKSLFQTLATSELAKLDIEQTNPDEIKQAFCRDMARVTRSYEVSVFTKFSQLSQFFCEISKNTVRKNIILLLFERCLVKSIESLDHYWKVDFTKFFSKNTGL